MHVMLDISSERFTLPEISL